MKPYLVTATDPKGRRSTFGRPAESIPHLRTVLEREGFTQIQFEDDEVAAQLRAQRAPHRRPNTKAEFRFEAKLRHGRKESTILIEALRRNAPVFVVAAGLVAVGLWRGSWVPVAIAAAIVIAWTVVFLRARRNAVDFNDLVRAMARGDNDAAGKLISRLRSQEAIRNNPKIVVDLEYREGVLLARRGKLDQALASVAALRDIQPSVAGMHTTRVAGIYAAAGETEKALALMEQSCEEAGGGRLQVLDLAFAHARTGSADRARELLERVEVPNLRPLHAGIYAFVQGVCAMRIGDFTSATRDIDIAVEKLKPFAESAPTWPVQGIVAGYAALVYARAGDVAKARATLAPWREVALTCVDPVARKAIQLEVPE